ncbi:MAG: PhoH family protein [Planctomycetota bacterium]|jgi:phosphate starvation-inducible PhoH-like protein
MAEVQIQLSSGSEALALLGKHDRNLKRIRDRLGVKVVLRDGALRILGEPADVERCAGIIHELLHRIRTGHIPDLDDIEVLLSGDRHPRPKGEEAFRVQALRHAVKPKSEGQKQYLEAIYGNDIVFVVGPAGTGKTYLAVAAGVKVLRKGEQKRLILARPAVEAGEKLGFLPGDFHAKVNPYLRPLYDALADFMEAGQIRKYIDREVFEVVPLAFMRGRTLSNAFIILDEAQNTTVKQMKMFLTRLGTRSKAIVTGDITQIDLPPSKKSGLVHALETLGHVGGIATVELTKADIVRHRLVQDIVDAYRIAEAEAREDADEAGKEPPSDPDAEPTAL